MSSSEQNSVPASLTDRLSAATSELHALEELVKSGDLDARVLHEFRNAVDHIRNTSWAVQQWVGATDRSADPYTLLPKLSAARVLRGTQLAHDLSLDLQTSEVGVETEGIRELFLAIDDLNRRLATIFNRD